MSIKRIGFPIISACAMLTACNGGGAPTTPIGAAPARLQSESIQPARFVQSVRAEVRFGLNRVSLDRAVLTRGTGSFPDAAKRKPVLFVSNLDSQTIGLYPANTNNPKQEGAITQGLNLPINIAVDKRGTLYVANNGNSTVTEYPFGQTKPSVTLSTSLVYPNGIAVDSKGTVYVTSGANVGSCYVLEFPKGATKPSVQVNGFGLPIGLAIDKNDNLYVADASENVVWQVPAGSTSPKNLNLPGLADPTGVAIDSANDLYVSNENPVQQGGDKIFGFTIGQTKPFVTITSDLNGPYTLGFEDDGTLFVGNDSSSPGNVLGFKKGKVTPFEILTNGIRNPAGIAVFPSPLI